MCECTSVDGSLFIDQAVVANRCVAMIANIVDVNLEGELPNQLLAAVQNRGVVILSILMFLGVGEGWKISHPRS